METAEQTLMQSQMMQSFLLFVYTHGFWLRLGLMALLALAAVFGARLYRRLVAALRKKLARYMPEWLQILYDGFSEPLVLLLRCLLLYWAVLAAPLPLSVSQVNQLAGPAFSAAVIGLLGWGLWRSEGLCGLLLRSAQNRLDLESNKTMTRFFEKIFRALVAAAAVLAILELFGVPVAGLLAGAGVAGLAVSLAAQSTLSNLIAGITLVLEHPFGIGDYVILGSSEGTVEDISFRSTRIRTTDNVAVTIENSKVCSEYIQNCNQRSSRLWQFTLGLTYDTTRAQLDTVCRDLTEFLNAQPTVQPGTVTATVDKFNDYSIDILVRVYLTTLPYGDFLRERSRLNLEIMDLVAKNGCSFAFPTTTLDMPAKS